MKRMIRRVLGLIMAFTLCVNVFELPVCAASPETEDLAEEIPAPDGAGDGGGTEKKYFEKNLYSATVYRSFSSIDFQKVIEGIDLRGVDYVTASCRVSTKVPYSRKTGHVKLVDETTGKVIGQATCTSRSMNTEYSFTACIRRGENETWNFTNASVYAALGMDTIQDVKNPHFTVNGINAGYPLYYLEILPDSGGVRKYTEKIYTGMDTYEEGASVDYPKPYFTDTNGRHSTELGVHTGQTVSASVWDGGGENSRGVAADSATLSFKGFKLAKPGTEDTLSGFISYGDSFTFDTGFLVKYRDYIFPGDTFKLVPIYEPLDETVEFWNSNATVDGKADVKGEYEGFESGYQLKANMLDSIKVSAKAGPGNTISNIQLLAPNGAMYSTNNPSNTWTRWKTVQDNSFLWFLLYFYRCYCRI